MNPENKPVSFTTAKHVVKEAAAGRPLAEAFISDCERTWGKGKRVSQKRKRYGDDSEDTSPPTVVTATRTSSVINIIQSSKSGEPKGHSSANSIEFQYLSDDDVPPSSQTTLAEKLQWKAVPRGDDRRPGLSIFMNLISVLGVVANAKARQKNEENIEIDCLLEQIKTCRKSGEKYREERSITPVEAQAARCSRNQPTFEAPVPSTIYEAELQSKIAAWKRT
ncbi:uncharacterized protein LOC130703030 [Daphnia carinata]|uniref:uncharacterized protein LOC130703030 n=1 Tax=Daphnia carinata TaxID=120202 RepID=UPI00257D876C|nr:uncharacterized protein LOC130703030 [Daphnia carinata]